MGCGALSANFLRKKIPLNVMLSITNRCMSRCHYCDIPSRNQRELTTDEVFSLIDQISALGCQRLGIWGGEPLMRKDIAQIINYAKDKDLFVTLDSNGYLLPQKIHQLENLDHLLLAFDGDQNAHDLNRGSGSFQKVMKAIESASGSIPFWTITVLTKNNLDSIDFILEQARKYGFLATFQLLHHNDRLSSDCQHLFPSRNACRSAIEKLISEKKKGAPIASSLNYLNHILNWPDYKTANYPHSINRLKCWAGQMYCNVDTDGSVYPCSMFVEKTKALNYLNVGFKKAFESLKTDSCMGCLASCFTEYNYLYSLNVHTITEWLKSFRKTKQYSCTKTVRL